MLKADADKPLVSIIIVNYNGQRFLDKCLTSVFKTNYSRFEVILVDNSSRDGSLTFLKQKFGSDKRLKVIKNSENLGFGPANNIGYLHSKGEYIAFLNNDTDVEPEWLRILVDSMEQDPTIGLAQSLVLDMDSQKIQTAGYLFSDYSVFVHPLCKGREDVSEIHGIFEVSTVMGAAMIAKKSFIEEIGLFDPKYFYYYDDDYLSFKTWLAGKRVVTVPTSKVHHVGSGTSDNAQSIYFNFKHSTIGAVSLNLDIYKNAGDILRGFFALWVHDFYRAFGEILAHRRACKFMGDFSAYRWTLSNFTSGASESTIGVLPK
ncbi:MAG: glycosyltransferase family 2 protein [Candidatus Bathyarchaeia archaeon]|jgi:GT2 family glycosyltransferase